MKCGICGTDIKEGQRFSPPDSRVTSADCGPLRHSSIQDCFYSLSCIVSAQNIRLSDLEAENRRLSCLTIHHLDDGKVVTQGSFNSLVCGYNEYRIENEQLREYIKKLERDVLVAKTDYEEARAWNESVAVCSKHTAEIVGLDCVICELEEANRRAEQSIR